MSLRTIASFAVAIFLGFVAVLLVRTYLTSQKPAAQQVTAAGMTPVVVANVPIQRGTVLQAGMLKVIGFTRESVPAGSFGAVNQVVIPGQPPKIALRELAPNEPVLAAKVSGPGAKANLAAALTPGMRAVGLRSSDVAGVGGFVLPGDRVDILLARQVGAGPTASTVVQALADNARVLGVDQSTDADKPTVTKAVTVEVTPQQAQAILLAQSVGTVSLSLRQSADLAPLPRHTTTIADFGGEGGHAARVRPAVKAAPPLPTVRVTRGVTVSGYPVSG
jgi:pilus assembly protein CpaB